MVPPGSGPCRFERRSPARLRPSPRTSPGTPTPAGPGGLGGGGPRFILGLPRQGAQGAASPRIAAAISIGRSHQAIWASTLRLDPRRRVSSGVEAG